MEDDVSGTIRRPAEEEMGRETLEEYAEHRQAEEEDEEERPAESSVQTMAAGQQRLLERQSNFSNFDTESLARMSIHSDAYGAGTAVTVTRMLSLDRAEWEQLLAKPKLTLQTADSLWGQDSESGAGRGRFDAPNKFRSLIGLPIINPFSTFSLAWHLIMVIMDLTYTAFVVPIGVGFDISDTAWTWGAVADFFAGLLFFIDLLLGFHTGYVVTHNYSKRIVMHGAQVAKWYVLRGSFWVDLLSSVAWVTQVVFIIVTLAGSNEERLASQIQIMRILRVVRLARLFKSVFLSASGQSLLPRFPGMQKLSTTVTYFLQLLYSIAVLLNFLGCLWYWVADREGIDGTWITEYGPWMRNYGGADGVLDAQIVKLRIRKTQLYLASVYWAFTTLAGVGYGDITPQTAYEEGVAIFVFLVGIIFVGVLIGSLTQLLLRASKDARKAQMYREKMDHVDSWLRTRRFPVRLRKRIRDYYGQFWVRQAEEVDEAELLLELPHTLRTEALWSMSRKSLVVQPMFATLPTPMQFLLASHVQPRKLPPGHDIITQGTAASKFWILDYGQVVPVYNDMEGEMRSESFMVSGSSLLQDLHLAFQRNLRGYRTITACGLWEWTTVSVLGVCRHHSGLYEHLAKFILETLTRYVLEEPESWPPTAYSLFLEAQERLAAKTEELKKLSSLAVGVGSAVTSNGQRDYYTAAEAVLMKAQAREAQEDAQSEPSMRGREDEFALEPTQLKRRSAVSFSEDTKAHDHESWRHPVSAVSATPGPEVPQIPPSPFAALHPSARLPSQAADVRVRMPSQHQLSLEAGESETEGLLEEDRIDAAEEITPQGLAASLANIQDQLTELRALLRRNDERD